MTLLTEGEVQSQLYFVTAPHRAEVASPSLEHSGNLIIGVTREIVVPNNPVAMVTVWISVIII